MPSRPLTAIYPFLALKPGFVRPRPVASPGQLAPPPKVLLLRGSLPERSCSRLCVEEVARLLHLLDAELKVYDPKDLLLPSQVADPDHPGLHELRQLSLCLRGTYGAAQRGTAK
jgi:arsenic resistance protein ArsH